VSAFWKVVVGLGLFVLFLVWRFPYEAAVKRSLYQISQATGAQIAWDGEDAGPLGVELRNVRVRMPGNSRVELTRATLRPTFGGLSATVHQPEGSANLTLDRSRTLWITARSLKVSTGNADLGEALVTVKNFTYSLATLEGKGDIGMVLPRLNVPLPIPLGGVELGAPVQIRPSRPGPGTEILAEVRLSGENFTGAGSVEIRSAPDQPSPLLAGVLDMQAGNIKGSVRLGGTWAKPTWNLSPASK